MREGGIKISEILFLSGTVARRRPRLCNACLTYCGNVEATCSKKVKGEGPRCNKCGKYGHKSFKCEEVDVPCLVCINTGVCKEPDHGMRDPACPCFVKAQGKLRPGK